MFLPELRIRPADSNSFLSVAQQSRGAAGEQTRADIRALVLVPDAEGCEEAAGQGGADAPEHADASTVAPVLRLRV